MISPKGLAFFICCHILAVNAYSSYYDRFGILNENLSSYLIILSFPKDRLIWCVPLQQVKINTKVGLC